MNNPKCKKSCKSLRIINIDRKTQTLWKKMFCSVFSEYQGFSGYQDIKGIY